MHKQSVKAPMNTIKLHSKPISANKHSVSKLFITIFSCFITVGVAWAVGIGSTVYGTDAATNEGASANYNTSIGDSAAYTNTSGDYNTMVGYKAGYANTGSDNTFLGSSAGLANTTGGDNTFIGTMAGLVNTTGSDLVIIGAKAGYANTTGTDNTFVGDDAGYQNTTGYDNTFVGEDAGRNNTTGYKNTFVGSRAGGHLSKTLTGINNVALGDDAGYTFSGNASRNTALGSGAGYDLGEGYGNTFVGADAGANTEYSDWSTFVGAFSGWDNNRTNHETNANRNTAIGAFAGYSNRAGEDNVWFGAFANSSSNPYSYDATLESDVYSNDYHGAGSSLDNANLPSGNTDVYRTTVIGAFAGAYDDDSVVLGYGATTSKTNSLAIGSEADVTGQSAIAIGYQSSSTHTEAIAIGYQAVSHGDYTVTLGSASTIAWDAGADGTTSLGTAEDCTYDTGSKTWSCNTPYRFANMVTQQVTTIAEADSNAEVKLWADNGEDYDDRWDIVVGDSGTFSIGSYASSSFSDTGGESIVRSELFTLENTGDLTLSGNLNLNSDQRLKTDIQPITNGLALVQQIQGVTYHWKPELNRSERKQYGVIAQNVEAVVPELVSEDKDGIKSVNYQGLIPILLSASQELQQQINAQNQQLENQQREIDELLALAKQL